MPESIAALLTAYLDHLRVERGASPHTLAAYRRDLDRYAAFLAARGVSALDAVTPTLVEDHAAHLRQSLAPASVARAVVAVRGLHRFAVTDQATTDDPARTVTPPHPPRRLPKALQVDQIQALLDAPDPDTTLGLRDRALLELLYGTGARITEAVSLDVDDVPVAVAPATVGPAPAGSAGLRLFGKGRKERIVPLGSYARAALAAYLVRSRPELSARGRATPALLLNARGGRLTRQGAWTIVRAAGERAGIAAELSPHTLRHSYATHLLDGGADVRVVQELLGHASVTTTQIYTLVTVDRLREVYLSAHPRAR